MKRCYKCQTPYVDTAGPEFHEVCESCGSYVHCCQNCNYYDDYSKTKCAHPDAEYVWDHNGMNRCEFFRFRYADSTGLKLDEREERPGMRLRPDWRGVKKGVAPRRSAGDDSRARRARDALDKLFRPSEASPSEATPSEASPSAGTGSKDEGG